MIKFLIILCFHGTKNYQGIFLFINSVSNIQYTNIQYTYKVYVTQYPTRGGIETMHEYLKTRSDKSISYNNLLDLASIILKNNYFGSEQLKYHQKEILLLGSSWLLYILTWLWQGQKREFFKIVNLNLSCGYDTLMRFFVY